MNRKRWLWFGSFVVVVLGLLGLMSGAAQTALTQNEQTVSRKTAVSQQGEASVVSQTSGEDTAVNIQSVNALIPDGSFEQIPSLWTEFDDYGCPYSSIDDWTVVTGFPARDGARYFWAGGRCDENSGPTSNYAEQKITIPRDNPALSFWYLSYNTEPNPTYEDFAYVELIDEQSEVFYRPWEFTMVPEANTNGWVKATIDLTPFAGREMTLVVGAENQNSGIVGEYAGSMFFDLFEFSDPPPTTSEIDSSGGFLQYNEPYTGNPVTEVIVPSGAVRSRTIMRYVPSADPGFPLSRAGESPLGIASLTYAGTAFDLDAFDQFVYLPIVVNGNTPAPAANGATVSEIAAPDAVTAPHSFQFNQPVTIRMYYDEAKLEELGVQEDKQYLYYWTGDGWKDAALTCAPEDYIDPPSTTYVRDLTNNWFELNVCHFSRFGTVGVN